MTPNDEPRSGRAEDPETLEAPIATLTGPRRVACLALGGVFVALAAIGVALPGLPTTPFLLLASFFLVRSSPRLNAVLLRSRWFGPVLRDWQEQRGVRRRVKLHAVLLMLVFVGGAVLLSDSFGALQLVTLGFGLVGLTVVARLPVVPERRERPDERAE